MTGITDIIMNQLYLQGWIKLLVSDSIYITENYTDDNVHYIVIRLNLFKQNKLKINSFLDLVQLTANITEMVEHFIPNFYQQLEEYKILKVLVCGHIPMLSNYIIGSILHEFDTNQEIYSIAFLNKNVKSPFTGNQTAKITIKLDAIINEVSSHLIKYKGAFL